MSLKDLDMDNVNYLVAQYDYSQGDLIIGLDILEDGSADMVVYDVSEMLEVPTCYSEFVEIVEENALDPEEFEINRLNVIGGRDLW